MSDAHRISPSVAPGCPELRSFVEWGFNMQLADIADLLRLPLADSDLSAGQNFTAASALLNLIAGASVWCFDASLEGLSNRQDRSRRFKEILERYWPWDGDGVAPDEGVNVLYLYARNPLAHTAGLPGPDDEVLITLAKAPLPSNSIDELGQSDGRPDWLGSTISPARGCPPGTAFQISVPGLYWSVQRLLRRLLADPVQAVPANDVAAATIRRLTDPNAPWRRPAS
jgi:hypothetical protein